MLIFSCPRCDCPAFTLPTELSPKSEASCARCRTPLGSWQALKGRLEGLLAQIEPPKAIIGSLTTERLTRFGPVRSAGEQ